MQQSQILDLRQKLLQNADEKTQLSGQRFFKEPVQLYGVKSALARSLAKDFYNSIKHLPKKDIFDICQQLWQSGMLEETFIASHCSEALKKQFEPDDFKTFAKWVENCTTNWASCDTFCNHTMGELVMKYPQFLENLKEWAHSQNRWVKRAAAVSLIIPARKGLFLNDIFEIATILLTDKDDMVQKGYGWMLKAASQAHQQQVFEFVLKNKSTMPRTALRYAIEKMPDAMKKEAMAR